MEELENALFLDQVPAVWTARAYPSLLGLTSWFVDLLLRLRELETWSTDFVVIIHTYVSNHILTYNNNNLPLCIILFQLYIVTSMCMVGWVL